MFCYLKFSFGEFKFVKNNNSLFRSWHGGEQCFFFSLANSQLDDFFFQKMRKKKTRNFCDFHGFVSPVLK
jgi:hypothetical protein